MASAGFPAYRLVHANPPTASDLESNAAKGRPPRGIERTNADVYHGISVFLERGEAVAVGRAFPGLGRYIARIEVPDEDTDIRMVEASVPRGSSHRTLVGMPSVFLTLVWETTSYE